MQDIVEFMQRRTGLGEGEIWQVLMELRDALVSFARSGQATKVPGNRRLHAHPAGGWGFSSL